MSLATIVELVVTQHPNADALELARYKGWQCVVKLGEFKTGDKAIYVEIDTWIPHEIAPFLSKGQQPREYEGVVGERLRTVKLRGELSQGLILPLSVLNGKVPKDFLYIEGTDVTGYLGIQKWHAPVPTALAGDVLPWPSYIPKTDQENIQNVYESMLALGPYVEWMVEEKLDGSSCTIYTKPDGGVGICSRNWELKQNEVNKNNAFILAANRLGLLEQLDKNGRMVALQAELCGPGIQGNPYQLKEPKVFVFDVYWMMERRYATWNERIHFLYRLGQQMGVEIPQVPFLELSCRGLLSLLAMLKMADGESMLQPKVQREGLVFKTRQLVNGRVYSFKIVSNQFLLGQK